MASTCASTTGASEASVGEEGILKILVTTDNHLGYAEKDPIRGEDSFVAFEECLEKALENDVDFILLGGDLFHDTNPSSNTLHQCLKLLRRYTLGDKPIEFEIVNDQETSFLETLSKSANYEDPNLNVSIPVFSIHGNHDDPSGFGRLSSLDILSVTGLVNYFGKWANLDHVNISPIMIRKGDTKLALFGLSHIYDTRLVRLFADRKVVLEKPADDSWFNLMVLHQNRADRGPKNYLPEEILPSFIDLIIWGHEHDCRIVPEQNEQKNFFVSQPGSTTPTSLSDGESIDKHCGLLLIRDNQFRMEPIKLQTIRPFIFDSMDLADYKDRLKKRNLDLQEQVKAVVAEKVEEMILRAEKKLTGHPKQPKLPIIRLRIQFSDEEQIFNTIRFGQNYVGRVANPADLILRQKLPKKREEVKPLNKEAMREVLEEERTNKQVRVEDIVGQYFDTVATSQKLKVLTSMSMSEVIRRLVESEDSHSADSICEFHLGKATEFLEEKQPEEGTIGGVLEDFQVHSRKLLKEALEALESGGVSGQVEANRQKFMSYVGGKAEGERDGENRTSDGAEMVSPPEPSVTTGRTLPAPKPRAARGASAAAKPRGGARGAKAAANSSTRTKAALDISVTNAKGNTSTRAPSSRAKKTKSFYDSESD